MTFVQYYNLLISKIYGKHWNIYDEDTTIVDFYENIAEHKLTVTEWKKYASILASIDSK